MILYNSTCHKSVCSRYVLPLLFSFLDQYEFPRFSYPFSNGTPTLSSYLPLQSPNTITHISTNHTEFQIPQEAGALRISLPKTISVLPCLVMDNHKANLNRPRAAVLG